VALRESIIPTKIAANPGGECGTLDQPGDVPVGSISIFLRSRRERANASVLARLRATSRAASFTSRTTGRAGMFGQHFALSGHAKPIITLKNCCHLLICITNHVLNSDKFIYYVTRNLGAKFVLKRHDYFQNIELICPQIFREASL